MKHPNGLQRKNNHINEHHEKRKNGPYIVPTFYLLLETVAILLSLYLVNGGTDFHLWNRYLVSATLVYFLFSTIRRYMRVVSRSKKSR